MTWIASCYKSGRGRFCSARRPSELALLIGAAMSDLHVDAAAARQSGRTLASAIRQRTQ